MTGNPNSGAAYIAGEKNARCSVVLLSIQKTCHNRVGDTTKTVVAQFFSHYAFQSGNRSSLGEILQTHRDKAAPFDKTKIASGS